MEYGQVPGIEKPISRLVQGTVYFSDKNADEGFAVYDAVFDLGCTTFDTANGYGGGGCERVLGQWIQSRGLRDDVVILGKGAHPNDGRPRVTPEDVTSDMTESLERLGVDFIDLYVLHRDDPSKPVEPIVDVLNMHLQAGRIRAFGGSNWSHERIKEANAYAEANGLTPFAVSSPQFSVATMVKPAWPGCISIGGDRAARDWYAANQTPLFTWSSLAGGFMTGKFRRDNLDSFSDYFDTVTLQAYCYEDNFARLDRAEELAAKKGVTLPQIALAYVLNQSLNTFALVGCLSGKEFSENAAALTIEITPEEIAWLEGDATRK